MARSNELFFERGSDPLGGDVPVERRIVLRLFGLPLVVESNAPRVIAIARDLFEHDEDSPDAAEPAPPDALRMRVIVEPSRNDGALETPMRWRIPDPDHAMMHGAGVLGLVNLAAGTATLYVDECVLRARGDEHFAQAVLQGPLLALPTRRDRHPIHAAAIRCGRGALVLHGRSGAGKSTLAYVASRAGLDVLCDDSIRVQRFPSLRVWPASGGGRHVRVHLREDARARFTELQDHHSLRLRNTGVPKHVVPLTRVDQDTPPFVERVRVCLLSPERGALCCEPATADEIVHAIVDAPEASADLFPPGRIPAAEAIAALGGWRLRLSTAPEAALPILRELLQQV